MHLYLTEMLVCPACREELSWTLDKRTGDRLEEGLAQCSGCGADYPIREGIGLFLTPDLRREDLWEQMDSHLIRYLNQHPETLDQLLQTPVEEMAAADLFFRTIVLEERGLFEQAQVSAALAEEGMYTKEYRQCSQSQLDFIVGQLSAVGGPIVDIASGRGNLVEIMAQGLDNPLVASDFSPRILRRNQRVWQHMGLYDQVSLLAFDARRSPFRDGSVKTLTTYLGLPNIEQPGELLSELRRITGGSFLAISHFYPEDDPDNSEALREAGLLPLLTQQRAKTHFNTAGWQVQLANPCSGLAKPTPKGEILEGAGIDAFPVKATSLRWCVLQAQ